VSDLAARLRGVVPPLATPFDSTGAVDAGSLRRLIAVQLAAGMHGASAMRGLGGGWIYQKSKRLVLGGRYANRCHCRALSRGQSVTNPGSTRRIYLVHVGDGYSHMGWVVHNQMFLGAISFLP